MQQAEDFHEEYQSLAELLDGCSPETFSRTTQFKNWTVEDVLGHLHMFNVAARLTLEDGAKFEEFYQPVAADMAQGKSMLEAQYKWLGGLTGSALYDTWRKECDLLAEKYAIADPKKRLAWAGPDMSARSSITARQMETWAHGQELFDLHGVTRKDTDRIKNIAHLGVSTYGWTFINRKEPVPEPAPSVKLSAPSGAVWEWGDPQTDNCVEGNATEFCQVVAQTRNIADTDLQVTGKPATGWMAIAQCFAGPAQLAARTGQSAHPSGQLMADRLTSVNDLPDGVQVPNYARETIKPGIVHMGVGAFFKSHLAAYTDAALSASGGDWSIIGISLRSPDAGDKLNPQNGLFTVMEQEGDKTHARVIGSLTKVICAPEDGQATLAALTASSTKIVSLTITEKAYGIDRTTGGVDLDDPSISEDLNNPQIPKTAIGFLVEALRQRREAGTEPFTVLCCDNLSENGRFLRGGVLDFAARIDPSLRDWIAKTTSFPSTMVDRITPASTEKTYALAETLTGKSDHAAVETEPFSQWVIEDDFPTGRPNWEAGGAVFVKDVAPYENMKLRMLNGAHSMIAYAGHLAGHTYVRDVMQDAELSQRVTVHLQAAAKTLASLPGIDFYDYAQELIARFRNPAIAHETYQIAMDGTQKLPQRLLGPAADALKSRQDITPFAFAVANWMRYCLGELPNGNQYDLRDPREDEIRKALSRIECSAENILRVLQGRSGLFPKELVENAVWNEAVTGELGELLSQEK